MGEGGAGGEGREIHRERANIYILDAIPFLPVINNG